MHGHENLNSSASAQHIPGHACPAHPVSAGFCCHQMHVTRQSTGRCGCCTCDHVGAAATLATTLEPVVEKTAAKCVAVCCCSGLCVTLLWLPLVRFSGCSRAGDKQLTPLCSLLAPTVHDMHKTGASATTQAVGMSLSCRSTAGLLTWRDRDFHAHIPGIEVDHLRTQDGAGMEGGQGVQL